jgi:DNA repair exonuclease SbcCD nuclease subunit
MNAFWCRYLVLSLWRQRVKMSTLWIGDVHARYTDLDDCRILIDIICNSIETYRPNLIVFLGDQYHTHGVVSTEVQKFWKESFDRIGKYPGDKKVIVGNHDKPGNANLSSHSLQCHTGVSIIDVPTEENGILYMPYYHDKQAFIDVCLKSKAKTVVCHQTFSGVSYGGFTPTDAIDVELIPQTRIVSGHIHSPMSFGKVWYPGSPRWLTLSDANIERFIYFEDGKNIVSIPLISHLTAIWQITDSENDKGDSIDNILKNKVKDSDLVTICLNGTTAWCEKRRKQLSTLHHNMRFRTFLTDVLAPKVKESDGIQVAFRKHLDRYVPKYGTDKEVLREMVSTRLQLD